MLEHEDEDGLDLKAFSETFAAYCRANCTSHDAKQIGLGWTDGACQMVADRTGDDVAIVKAVYRGLHDPTLAILDDMKWIRVKSYKVVPMRVECWKYLSKEVAVKPTPRLVYPL